MRKKRIYYKVYRDNDHLMEAEGYIKTDQLFSSLEVREIIVKIIKKGE